MKIHGDQKVMVRALAQIICLNNSLSIPPQNEICQLIQYVELLDVLHIKFFTMLGETLRGISWVFYVSMICGPKLRGDVGMRQ